MALSGNGRLRQPLREVRHSQRSHFDNFSGVGLSSRLKTGQPPGASASFVSSATPQGKLHPNRLNKSFALLMVPFSCTTTRRCWN